MSTSRRGGVDSIILISGGAGDPQVLAGTVDPSAGAGVAAAEGSTFLRYAADAGESWLKTGAADTAWTQQTSTGGGSFQVLEVVNATSPSSVFGNDVGYLPLRKSQSDNISFQTVAESAVPTELAIVYSMSAANAGDVSLRLDLLINSDGEDPATPAAVGITFTVTPGNDVLQHVVDSSNSGDLLLAVARGDLVYGSLHRVDDANDTHTGDLRILQLLLRQP